jgi:hypothetical protein
VKDTARAIQLWVNTLVRKESTNLALDLLWDALGGDDELERSCDIIQGQSRKRVDDTTLVVLQL